MALNKDETMRKNWRGRRLLACRAAEDLHMIIRDLGLEDGSQLPPNGQGFTPPPSDPVRLEMQNTAANLLRMILAHNDRGCSPSKLNRF
tara:strand:- start:78 stop:344 length:267 start_codon:yes stop_codon:yes gene_type:complete